MRTFSLAFYEWFRKCPIVKDKLLNYDYHTAQAGEHFIDASTGGEKIKVYRNGSSVWQKPIYYCTILSTGKDARIQIENQIDFEEFQLWVEQMNSKNELPELPENNYPIKIECTSDAFPYETETNTAIYQIQLILTYQKNKGAK